MEFSVDGVSFQLRVFELELTLCSAAAEQARLCEVVTRGLRLRPVELLDSLWSGRSVGLPGPYQVIYAPEQVRLEGEDFSEELDRGFFMDVVLDAAEAYLETVGWQNVDWIDDLSRPVQDDLGIRQPG